MWVPLSPYPTTHLCYWSIDRSLELYMVCFINIISFNHEVGIHPDVGQSQNAIQENTLLHPISHVEAIYLSQSSDWNVFVGLEENVRRCCEAATLPTVPPCCLLLMLHKHFKSKVFISQTRTGKISNYSQATVPQFTSACVFGIALNNRFSIFKCPDASVI